MTLPRRQFLQSLGGVAALAAMPQRVLAQTAPAYPSRPLRWIVGFAAGGAADGVARLIAVALSQQLGQQVLVENRPGAGSHVATRTVLDAQPDGHTLLLIGSSTVVHALLNEQHQATTLQDIVPVAMLTVSAFVILVNSGADETTLADLIGFAKQNPGTLRVGSYGIGTQSHLAAQLFNHSAGVETVHVPYRGGAPLVGDLLGRHIHVAFDTVSSALPHIRAGTLRPLAVTTAHRLAGALQEVPAAGETLPGYEIVAWIGLGLRQGTASQIVDRLNREVNLALASPEIAARLSDLAIESAPCDLERCAAFWSSDVERTLAMIRQVGLKLE